MCSESADEIARARVLKLIAGFALARLALAFALGFGVDEAYTIAISRRLDLSYFDHPPLHQWIAHFAGLAVHEGPLTRLPFIALFALTGWLIFVLTRALFSARAGLWATFALNLSPFFLISGGGWVVPDGPLLLTLCAAAIVFARLFFDERASNNASWRDWLLGGFFLGLAGLSKYSAALFPIGLLIFMMASPRQRRWFTHPAPYAAAILCMAMLAPVIVWNLENQWVSFAFQGDRGAPAGHWRPIQLAQIAVGEIAWLGPWIFVPLILAMLAAARAVRRDERVLFLLCLATPPVLIFTIIPLWGARGLPHWPMPGWLFAYPLLGAWLADGARRFNRMRWAIASTAVTTGLVALALVLAATGWLSRVAPSLAGGRDPTIEAFAWDQLRASPLLSRGADAPAFVVANKWSDAGKIALALGPATPILIASDDPRGIAFLDNPERYIGEDGVIVVQQRKIASASAAFAPYFASLDAPQTLSIGRLGHDEIELVLIRGRGLVKPFPLPYPIRDAPPAATAIESAQ
jgi:hypothetical protein